MSITNGQGFFMPQSLHISKMRIFALIIKPRIMRHSQKRLRVLFTAFLLGLACSSCHNGTPTVASKIDRLKQQVIADSTTLHTIRTVDFPKLENRFQTCDMGLQNMPSEEIQAAFEKLNLTQAYLHQFAEVSPIMRRKFEYTLLQLDRLKTDVESHYLADSVALSYLEDETKVADTLHNQVVYFKDRFSNCQNDMSQLEKSQK